MPSYCVQGPGKEPRKIKDKDGGDSVSIHEATTNKHTKSWIPRPETAQHGGRRQNLGLGSYAPALTS